MRQHTSTRWWTVSAALAIALLSACGGSDDDEPTGNTSSGSITKAKLDSCPSQGMSPVDMKQLGCLVGSYTGRVVDNKTQQLTDKTCGMAIDERGAVVLSLNGQSAAQHQISTQADTSGNGTTGSIFKRVRQGFMLNSRSDADGSGLLVNGVTLSGDAPWVLTVGYVPPGASDASTMVVCTGSVS